MTKKIMYTTAVKFHGHSCQGLAIGYRVAEIALNRLKSGRSVDEELVAVVENNSCSVDAIQCLCGCTFGKGNFFFKDHGKHVYTFFNRKTGKGIRVYVEPFYLNDSLDTRFVQLVKKSRLSAMENKDLTRIKAIRVRKILTMPESSFITVTPATGPLPEKAMIFDSIRCDKCGEKVMATRIIDRQGKQFCIPCSGRETHS